MRRQPFGEACADRAGIQAGGRRRGDERGEHRLAIWRGANADHGVTHAGNGAKRELDLAEVNAVSTDFRQRADSADKLESPVGQQTADVVRYEPAAPAFVRVGLERA